MGKETSLKELMPTGLTSEDVVFVCIGTDRSTGDSLGPLVGQRLQELGYQVYGTLQEPVHALNLTECRERLPKDKIIIAIDACLGKTTSVGKVKVKKGPMIPGAGVNKNLGEIGDYSIAGVVNVAGFMEYFVLQNTRLSIVLNLRDQIVDMVTKALPVVKVIQFPRPTLSSQVRAWINKALYNKEGMV